MPHLNGIDISGWQKGINLAAVPCDFAICKATQGTGFTSDDCVRQVEQALSLGKLVGVYHYIGGQGARAEMDFFIRSIKNWVGKVMLVLDWESNQNSAWRNESYLDACVARVIELTGIPPVIYASKSVFPWNICKKYNCGAWVAQYANNNATGYQSAPWNEGSYTCAIRQYTSSGRLPGYNGNLDLNKFYGDRSAWMKYCNPSGTVAPPSTPSNPAGSPSGSTLDLVYRTMKNEFGVDNERRKNLGGRYNEVQDFINHIDKASTATLVSETWAGKYGNDPVRRTVLGKRYDEVMAVINKGNKSSMKVGSTVQFTSPYDYNGTHLAVGGNYTVMEIKGDRVVVGRGGVVTAAVKKSNLKVV